MNPSASGWIVKLNSLLARSAVFPVKEGEFYPKLRESGFVYGTNVKPVLRLDIDNKLTEEELSKVHLYMSLLSVYYTRNQKLDFDKAIDSIIAFYTAMESNDGSFFNKLLTGNKGSSKLEKIIGNRVLFDENILTKNFNRIPTNMLLYIDALTYGQYLDGNENCMEYAGKFETYIINTIYRALDTKAEKNEYDEQLVKLFESSTRYTDTHYRQLEELQEQSSFRLSTDLEKKYVVDLASLAIWSDSAVEDRERNFIETLVNSVLHLPLSEAEHSLTFVQNFFNLHREEIPILNFSNPVKQFYDNSSKMVSTLILRNKKRLQSELLESKELVVLLSKSTVKDLSEEEKQKVKTQLLDICKSVPSLAIFLLPGGGVLLPLLVKFIPRLLPSSFDDNKLE
ncbi:LETM1-related biofilm-associated protein [Sinomicrobium sp.]